jgi:YegS/Rv2252/BmrU family lipid kinase
MPTTLTPTRRGGAPRTDQRSRSVILVPSPMVQRSERILAMAREAVADAGLEVIEVVDIPHVDRLRQWIGGEADDQPLFVAAGGDGTVGAVVGAVANTGAVMGILPLGTSNDVARTLLIPPRIRAAARVLVEGKVANVDVGRFAAAGEPDRFFVHAAAMGLDVEFARLATQPAFRERLGRLAYAAAGFQAIRHRRPFQCQLAVDGRSEQVSAIHLSVVNAPVFGGRMRLTLPGSSVNDRRLDILIVEDMPVARALLAAVPLVLRRRRLPRGIRLFQAASVHIHSDNPMEVILDGELTGSIPGDFDLVAEGLQVMVPKAFIDRNDRSPARA